MKAIFIISAILAGSFSFAFAQQNIPLSRQAFHDNVNNSQLALEAADGTSDGQFTPYHDNNKLNQAANDAATKGVDNLEDYIEQQDWDNNKKIKYLRGLYRLLDTYKASYLSGKITGAQLVNVLKEYKAAMNLDSKGEDITPVIEGCKSYEAAYLLTVNDAFRSNTGKDNFNNILVRKELDEHPSNALMILNNLLSSHRNFLSTDSILHTIALDSSDAIYNYASSYTPLGEYIRKSSDPLVRAISEIANAQGGNGSRAGRQYMPFLDELYHGNLTMDQIQGTLNEPVQYFKLLVRTEINYASRAAEHDTALAWQTTRDKIQEVATDNFVNIVNGLHEKPNDVRYACLKPLSALDLYYLIVAPVEENIYTSSYVNGKDYGIYNLIWQKGGKDFTGDSLMLAVKFDYFKKWIKLAANYNTLDNFLGRMQPDHAQMLMKAFVRNLDKNTSRDSLEDAVNVAASYSSIDQPEIKQLVLNEVQNSLSQAKREKNEKAYNIYYILNTLFLSMDSTNNIDVSAKLGIEPVYFMPIDKLKDSAGRIIIQQTTYGDLDGRTNYDNFMGAFAGLGWKETSNQYWSTVSSTKGVPITIYTNKPLDENQHLDDDAQNALNDYLDENDIHPTLIFHRGHSYYLKSTISQMQSSEKVVFLGSCGGFQSLHDVFSKAPGAQIISTKQTGVGDLNLSMIRNIILTLQKGQSLNWVKMWHGFNKQLSNDTRFADYVPPYENLGAVFLVAYQKLQDKETEQADSKDITVNKNAGE